MASTENTGRVLENDEVKYTKSDNDSAEKTSIVQPEGKLKRQLKNRHVAMIRFVIHLCMLSPLVSSRLFDASVSGVLSERVFSWYVFHGQSSKCKGLNECFAFLGWC